MSGKSPYRSVKDYSTTEELRKALMSMSGGGAFAEQPHQQGQQPEASSTTSGGGGGSSISTTTTVTAADEQPLDWLLPMYDRATTEPQSMREELARLTTLHSYLILDAEKEESFDRLTAVLARLYNVPIAIVSLIDLGRQWLVSNHGAGQLRETSRAEAFCSHAINTKDGLLIVPDTKLDRRFVNHCHVTGPPYVRFYAGSSLISPEGYKLGTVCIIDTEPRPDGLSVAEVENLRDLAAMAMKTMVDRRQQMRGDNHAKTIAQTAHDLLTPLTAIQLSLSLLKDDESVTSRLTHHQNELLRTASSCSEIMTRICQHTMEGAGKRQEDALLFKGAGSDDTADQRVLVIHELLGAINTVLDPMPKAVPLYMSVDVDCPPMIATSDLKIFRSCLNLLMNALQRTERGFVAFRIRKSASDRRIVFECEDSGPNVVPDDANLFHRVGEGGIGLGLASIATQVVSLGGHFGCRLRNVGHGGSMLASSHSRMANSDQGAVFWFCIPIRDSGPELPPSTLFQSSTLPVAPTSNWITFAASDPNITGSYSNKKRKAVKSIWTGAMQGSCDSQLRCRISSLCSLGDIHKRKEEMLAAATTGHNKRNAEWGTTGSDTLRHPQQQQIPRTKLALVVDDSVVVRKSIGRALERLGFSVSMAEDGIEGLTQLKGTVFDITLLDFLMPNLDGIDCAKQYRQWEVLNRPGVRQNIIGISAHADGKDQQKGMDAGMDGFRPKPISMKTLSALTGCEVVQQSVHGGSASLAVERKDVGSAAARSTPVVLIASDVPTARPHAVLKIFAQQGWNAEIVNDAGSCLRELQKRNWNFVLIDDDLPDMSGVECIQEFRAWERANRVQSQKHVYLVSEGCHSMTREARMYTQPPHGFNGVLSKPVPWGDLRSLIEKSEGDGEMEIIVR